MNVITVARFGGPEVLSYGEAPSPAVGPHDARVRVALAGVNYGDLVLRAGDAFEVPRPYVPGCEAVGRIEALGAEVRGRAVGERVAVPLFTIGRLRGGYASEIAFEAARLVPIPDDVSDEAATALQVQGLSAWRVFDRAPIAGRTVLVHAAAGGSGSLLVQLARVRGAARVIATASTAAKRAHAEALGADVAIDYTDAAWPALARAATDGRGVDVIIDPVGGRVRAESVAALAPGGTLVMFGYAAERGAGDGLDAATLRALFFGGQTVASAMHALGDEPAQVHAELQRLFALVQRGALRVPAGTTFPLARASDAHRALGSRGLTGKVFLAPGPTPNGARTGSENAEIPVSRA